jgi:hypothetical protein
MGHLSKWFWPCIAQDYSRLPHRLRFRHSTPPTYLNAGTKATAPFVVNMLGLLKDGPNRHLKPPTAVKSQSHVAPTAALNSSEHREEPIQPTGKDHRIFSGFYFKNAQSVIV